MTIIQKIESSTSRWKKQTHIEISVSDHNFEFWTKFRFVFGSKFGFLIEISTWHMNRVLILIVNKNLLQEGRIQLPTQIWGKKQVTICRNNGKSTFYCKTHCIARDFSTLFFYENVYYVRTFCKRKPDSGNGIIIELVTIFPWNMQVMALLKIIYVRNFMSIDQFLLWQEKGVLFFLTNTEEGPILKSFFWAPPNSQQNGPSWLLNAKSHFLPLHSQTSLK